MPVENQPLYDEDARRIKRNWTFLKTNLTQDEIRDKFMVEGIWDFPDFDKIDAEKTPEEKNEEFLKLLLRSGPRAYKLFIEALQEKHLTNIIQKLQNTQTENYSQEPFNIIPLTDVDANRIKHNWRFLKEHLLQQEIRDIFIDEGVWDIGAIEEIDAEKTPKEKNETFLKMLIQSGQRAYEIFIVALQEKCSTHIIEKLQNTSTTKDYPLLFENPIDRDIFENWQQEDELFVQTKSSRKVENMINLQNLVIIAGQSGCGKSAIAQHIALKYKRKGWNVKPVDGVEEIKEAYRIYTEKKTVFVLHDPIGKERFSEFLYTLWEKYEETLKVFLDKVKIILTCRTSILSDRKVKGLFEKKENIVIVDEEENKLGDEEKRQIFKKHNPKAEIIEIDLDEIVKTEELFPLLCKFFAKFEDGLTLFRNPIEVVKDVIRIWKRKDARKYCSLVCLILFDNICSVTVFEKNEHLFKKCLKLCGLPESSSPETVKASLELLEGYFVKKIGDTFHFYHDFVMEVTTFAFGQDYPAETIKYADIGFLRRRVRLEKCSIPDDLFIIYLRDTYITDLVKRFLNEIVGDRFLEVVLNPCLRNEKLTNLLIKSIMSDSGTILETLRKKIEFTKPVENTEVKKKFFSRLYFLDWMGDISPLTALIVFGHDKISLFCLKALRKMGTKFHTENLLPAVCCNGSKQLFRMFTREEIGIALRRTFGTYHEIHIVSAFHNYELLNELDAFGVDVNMKIGDWPYYTPLILAVANDTSENLDFNEQDQLSLRDKTVEILLGNRAMVNLCDATGGSPLFVACYKGNYNTTQLLLHIGADVNLCKENGISPLFIACKSNFINIVVLLLKYNADVNLTGRTGASPLYIACLKGHDTIVQLLLNYGACVNLRTKKGVSPLYIACECGNHNTAQILLNRGANVNLCEETGASPLFIACQNGHASTVQVLLNYNAEVNLREMENEPNPLSIACFEGHENIVKLLLNHWPDVNLCEFWGTSPFTIAKQKGHDSIVNLFLEKARLT
uniref:Uncharacterized protein LOC111101793 n=1 Tax=Crassostrea virginica TaxID=6565 RepID=A0A8B8AFD9_CRAVI|nr:uncharacterized protein LOC111101793 [Crassostrea virginica]